MNSRNLAVGIILFSVACASPKLADGPPDAGQSVDAQPDGGADAGSPAVSSDGGLVDTGRVFMAECLGYNSQCAGSPDPNCGRCEYRIAFDPAKCSGARPCDNLLLFFSAMGCDKGPMEETVRNSADFVAACVQPLAPGELLPSSLGAPQRDNMVVGRVLQKAREQAWTGKNLLIGGCSAGGTRYPVVAARHADEQAWVGSAKTAVCMSEGVLDVVYQDKFMGEKASVQSCQGRHGRVAHNYTSASASPTSAHSCTNSPICGCDPLHAHRTYPGDCASTGGDCVKFDSILKESDGGFVFNDGVGASDFAVRDWKLISEGSAFENTDGRCDDDIVPEGPYKALCQLLDADPNHTCTHLSVPDQHHCAYYVANFTTACVDWFKAL